MSTATPIPGAQAELGEGPLWHHDRLYWVDITGHALYCTWPDEPRHQRWQFDRPVTAVLPRRAGGLVLAMSDGLYHFDPARGSLALLHLIEDGQPTRCNDAKCDAAGRLWVGTMPWGKGSGNIGALYRYDTAGRLAQVFFGISCSNGLAWSADQCTLYYIDTGTRRVDRCALEPLSGTVLSRQPLLEVAPALGYPDGMAIDAEGHLWVGHWGGWAVVRYHGQTGAELARVALPVARVTSCAFGGPGFERLYITTARTGLTAAEQAAQPLAGALFVTTPGVCGLPAEAYGG
jgi:sugar lactone lactonase YvrE